MGANDGKEGRCFNISEYYSAGHLPLFRTLLNHPNFIKSVSQLHQIRQLSPKHKPHNPHITSQILLPSSKHLPTSMRSPPSSSMAVASVSLLIVAAACVINYLIPSTHPSLLQALAADQFAWAKSTTDIPISTVSVLAKSLLSRDRTTLPSSLHHLISESDTIPIQPVRDVFYSDRLARVKKLCKRSNCDFNQKDSEFGLTPLHLASFAHDHALSNYLEQHGAMPVEDHVGRLPRNMSFQNFIRNAKNARKEGSDCDFPIVDFGADIEHARRETRRLVGEGEPVLLRGAFAHYAPRRAFAEWTVEKWIEQFGDNKVTVGAVPYARAFNLSTRGMNLREFYQRFVQNKEADNMYIFNKDVQVCEDGYATLAKIVEEAFPTDGLIVHPDHTGELKGIHYFFGRPGSGAPFHIHADAINAAANGRKQWFVYTPARTLYSRKTMKRWTEEDLPSLAEEDKPLQCVQHPGDVVYVPLDWGHGVLNLDENTFGFALELLNRRDTLAHLTGH